MHVPGGQCPRESKEDKKTKKEKKAEPEEQPKKVKDKNIGNAKPPNLALKKPKIEEEDNEVFQIKTMRKAPQCKMLQMKVDPRR